MGEVRNPIMVFVLSMVTCGIYGLYWMVQVMGELNQALGEERYKPVRDIALAIVTCGLYGLYISWTMSEAIVEVEKGRGVAPKFEPVLLFITALFGLFPLLAQLSLNNAWEAGGTGGTPGV